MPISEIDYNYIIKDISILKHRIAHLFLSIDIDLQGIDEVLRQKREEAAKEYFEEAFGEGDRLGQRLEETKKILNGNPDAQSGIEKKGIKGIIEAISELEKKSKANGIFETIKNLLNDGDIKKLAGIVANKNNFEQLKTFLDEARTNQKKSFNQWLVELDKAMDDLRGVL